MFSVVRTSSHWMTLDDTQKSLDDNAQVRLDRATEFPSDEIDMDNGLIAGNTTTMAKALVILTHAAKPQIPGSQLDDLLKLINY